MTRVPVDAFYFEDFIDGYFPLAQSLRYLMDRQTVDAALLVLRVAPIMEIPDLAPEAPVPLHINPTHAGQIDWLAVVVQRVMTEVHLSGHALWTWANPNRPSSSYLLPTIRLAEPAFVRGIGFRGGSHDLKSLGPVAVAKEDRGVSVSSQTPLRFEKDVQSKEISWPLSDSSTVVRLSATKDLLPPTDTTPAFQDRLVLSKSDSPLADRFASDLLSALN